MAVFLRTVLYWCCMAIALISGIAALTITVAIVTNKLPDSEAWMAVAFFAAAGGAAWIAGRAARFWG
jgi:energy-converting hydrogenase Eha subunit A